MKTIVLTGGGTAGHVTPNIALIPALEKSGFKICYIGSIDGMEKELIRPLKVPYYGIPCGKLRRYIDMKNITDMFKVIVGIKEAFVLLKKIKPDVVFSKGGFVAVPVVIAAKLLRIPVIIHESDITAGLANRIAMPFASVVCASFPETFEALPKQKAVLTGTPIRRELFHGSEENARLLTGFNKHMPVILFMGGSQGSTVINTALREALPHLLTKYQIIHICGKHNVDDSLNHTKGYKQFEYVSDELPDLFSIATLFVSRAGANSIYEFLALKKPNLLIPLSKNASRGDQILNAASFENQGFSKVLFEEELNQQTLTAHIDDLYEHKEQYIEQMRASNLSDGILEVMKVIRDVVYA